MKQRIITLFLLFSVIASTGNSQSIYKLQYNFNQADDSITYRGIFIRYSTGEGLMRIKYIDPATKQWEIAELETTEEFLSDASGNPDVNILITKAVRSGIIGDSTKQFNSPFFISRIDKATGYFEPTGISRTDNDPAKPKGAVFTASLLRQDQVTKSWVTEFFNKNDEFVINFFKPKSRGGFTLFPDEKKIKIHLLLVADTKDKHIGNACKYDIDRVLRTFDTLSKHMGLQLVSQTISGNNLSKMSIEAAIAALKPSPNDMVVFYYSGHGFRIPENNRRFPNLKILHYRNERKNFTDSLTWVAKDRQDKTTYTLNMEDIFNSIKSKRARFNLVLSDCCNDDIFGVPPVGGKPPGMRGFGIEWGEKNIRSLFLNETPVSILASATRSGERAGCNDEEGGYFTHYLLVALQTFLGTTKNDPTWKQILESAARRTKYLAAQFVCDEKKCQQNPDYDILIEKE